MRCFVSAGVVLALWFPVATGWAAAPEDEPRVEAPRRVSEPLRAVMPATEVVDGQTLRLRASRDLGDALQVIPGVQVVEFPDGRRTLMVEGLLSRVLWCVDGWPLPRAADGTVDLGELPATVDEVLRVEVVRQSMSHVYGSGAEGGVINVVTHRLQETRASATAAVRLLPNGHLGGVGSAGGSYAGQSGGVYAHGAVQSDPLEPGLTAQAAARRVMGVSVGGAFRLHPRVLWRGDASARETLVEGAQVSAPAVTRRAQLGMEMATLLTGGDSVRLTLRMAGVERASGGFDDGRMSRVVENVAALAYAGEPIPGHQVQADGVLWGDWGEAPVTAGGGLNAQRLRASAMVGDNWRVSRAFSLEGALRLEATDKGTPSLGPSLAFRYEPFRHVFARGSVSAGYRQDPLMMRPMSLPGALGALPAERSGFDTGRSVRAGVSFEPNARIKTGVELFRTELAGAPLAFETGALTAGVTVGQFAQPFSSSAHVQGVRLHAALLRMPGGVGLQGGYVFLQQAADDVSGNRLALAPRHSASLRVLWEPAWLALSLHGGVEVLVDRVDGQGRVMANAVVPHLGGLYQLGPLQVGCVVDNILGAADAHAGIRAGRSARCFVAAAP